MDDRETGPLAGRLEAGDFPRIIEEFGPPSLALAMNILGNREDAEDACQEAFLQVFRNLERFDNRAGFQPWLFTILYRRCLDVIRKRKRSRRLVDKAKVEQASAARGRRPAGEIAADRRLDPALLDGLSPRERTALSLWANEGYTALDIARVLGASAATARVHLHQARKKLKAILEKNHVVLQGR